MCYIELAKMRNSKKIILKSTLGLCLIFNSLLAQSQQSDHSSINNPFPEDTVVIDLLYSYTQYGVESAKTEGFSDMNEFIEFIHTKIQAVYDSNRTGIIFKRLGDIQIDYDERNDGIGTLGFYMTRPDLHDVVPFISIHEKREEIGADMMIFLGEWSAATSGGSGSTVDPIKPLNNPGVVIGRISDLINSFTLSHEMGHSLGCGHSRDQLDGASANGNAFEFSTGSRWLGDDGKDYCSIMSYPVHGGGTSEVVPLFSSPSLYHQGQPTGNFDQPSGPSDNLSTIKFIKHYAAEYRRNKLDTKELIIPKELQVFLKKGESTVSKLALTNGGSEPLTYIFTFENRNSFEFPSADLNSILNIGFEQADGIQTGSYNGVKGFKTPVYTNGFTFEISDLNPKEGDQHLRIAPFPEMNSADIRSPMTGLSNSGISQVSMDLYLNSNHGEDLNDLIEFFNMRDGELAASIQFHEFGRIFFIGNLINPIDPVYWPEKEYFNFKVSLDKNSQKVSYYLNQELIAETELNMGISLDAFNIKHTFGSTDSFIDIDNVIFSRGNVTGLGWLNTSKFAGALGSEVTKNIELEINTDELEVGSYSAGIVISQSPAGLDGDTINLHLKVIGEVDHEFSINENSENNMLVGSIGGTVGNSYFLNTESHPGTFDVNSVSGDIIIKDNTELNFEENPVHYIEIVVDNGVETVINSLFINLIDVNEVPSLAESEFLIEENSTNGSIVGDVAASDPDGNPLSYSIISGNSQGVFQINQSSGEISIADSTSLDFENNPNFNLTVEASDGELSANATISIVLIDRNEAPSIFEDTFTIDENSPVGTSVGVITSSDPENDILTFSIVSGNDLSAFQIDQSTGEISVTNTAPLDFEINTTFQLSVEANDDQLSDIAFVTVNLNNKNEAPSVSNVSFAIDENSVVGTSVGTITSSDPENDILTFSIVAGNDLSAFEINGANGEILVADSIPLDFEINPIFEVLVEVSDGELSNSASVIVNLNDLDDVILRIVDQEGNRAGLYPNPTNNFIEIEWKFFEKVSVLELSGKEIFSSNNRSIALKALKDGVYLLVLSGTNGEQLIFRVIKE
jgi:hypothetical protein